MRLPLDLRCLAVLFVLVWPAGDAAACYAVVAGRGATADGSVLVGHNEQNGPPRILNFRKVPLRQHGPGEPVPLRRGGSLPQAPQTAAMLWSEHPGLEYSDSYLNQFGVAITSDGCRSREEDYDALVARGEIRHGGIGYMLRRLVAQRARTAREGVQLAGQWVEQFGYADSGRTYVIADPKEAWLLAVVRGRRWVAQRVPDDAVVILPNVYIIGPVDLADDKQFLGCPDLIQYATSREWFAPAGGEPFCFWRGYGSLRAVRPDPRQWVGQQLALGRRDPWPPQEPLPFSVRPPRKLTVADVCEILRSTDGPAPLSTPSTQESAVFQLRPDLPPEIGCVYWRTTAEPITSVFTPWYAGITETPECYYRPCDLETHLSLEHHFSPPAGTFDPDPGLAWWTFKTLQDLVRKDVAARAGAVRPVWRQFEQDLFARQADVEKKALALWAPDRATACRLLTSYCAEVAQRAREQARRLADALRR